MAKTHLPTFVIAIAGGEESIWSTQISLQFSLLKKKEESNGSNLFLAPEWLLSFEAMPLADWP